MSTEICYDKILSGLFLYQNKNTGILYYIIKVSNFSNIGDCMLLFRYSGLKQERASGGTITTNYVLFTTVTRDCVIPVSDFKPSDYLLKKSDDGKAFLYSFIQGHCKYNDAHIVQR